MKEVNISLGINDLNLILEALGHQPYVRVYELIDKLQNQARTQLNGSAASVDMNRAASQPEAKPRAAETSLS